MLEAKVTKVVSRPFSGDDFDESTCLCAGKVPSKKAVEYANRVFRERDEKWVWKLDLRYHADCPHHGTSSHQRKTDRCPEG